jgi:hypothetical protein
LQNIFTGYIIQHYVWNISFTDSDSYTLLSQIYIMGLLPKLLYFIVFTQLIQDSHSSKVVIVGSIPVAVGDNRPTAERVNAARYAARAARRRKRISPAHGRRRQPLAIAPLIVAAVCKDRILGHIAVGAAIFVGVAGTGLSAGATGRSST